FKTSHPYESKRSPFARTFRKPQFAKLEGVEDQNPWDVLYEVNLALRRQLGLTGKSLVHRTAPCINKAP
ncbi:hypothetical protein OFM39_33665, partial [Escherichia coli]|nr:hypothetical protein [Escherichia coli]